MSFDKCEYCKSIHNGSKEAKSYHKEKKCIEDYKKSQKEWRGIFKGAKE